MSWYQSIFVMLLSLSLFANPKGIDGKGELSTPNDHTLIVKTGQDKTVLNWKEFSIQKGEVTQFVQPSTSSATLNRVIGGKASEILGQLESNGHLYLLNPSGILVGEGAMINTTSFIGSTFDVLDSDFLNGEKIEFFGDSTAKILNYGVIKTKNGDALLISRDIENIGILEAEGGCAAAIGCTSLLYRPNSEAPFFVQGGAANHLNTEGNPFSHAIKTDADPDALHVVKKGDALYLTSVKNSGTIQSKRGTQGGEVFILADQVDLNETSLVDVSGLMGGGKAYIGGSYQGKDPNLLASQMTHVAKGGVIEASALERGNGGNVVIWSDQATRYFGHTSVRGGTQKGDGGSIEISTPTSQFTYRGTVDTTAFNGKGGTLLLDPNDIIIGPAGTDGGFSNPYTGAGFQPARLLVGDLTAALAGGANVLVQTSAGTAGGSGDITVTATVTWAPTGAGNSILTLNAARDVNVQADIIVSGGGGGGGVDIVAGRDYNSTTGSAVDIQTANGPLNMTVGRNINALGSFENTDASGVASNVTVIAQTGNITLGSAASTVPVVFGSINGAVYVEATLGSIFLNGGSGATDDVAVIGFYEPSLALFTPTSGPITVLARNDIILQSGTGAFAHAMICKQGRNPHDVTNNPILVTAGRDLFIQSGNATDAPGAGIGRPQQIVGIPVNHSGNIVINVGRDCTIFGGDNFSGIGDRGFLVGGVGSIAANLDINVGRNLMMGHGPGLPGISGAFIGIFDNQFGIIGSHESTRGYQHINVGNNFVMDSRLGSAFVEFQNDNRDLANFPSELFVHVGNSLILLGAPLLAAPVSASFDFIETINSSAHFWTLNSIQCVNGTNGAANLHSKAFNSTAVVSANLGTINVRAGGDIRVAGGAVGRVGDSIIDYEATGGFTYIADSPFSRGELWGPQTALVGGVNIFAGTPLGTFSSPVVSNGLGAISFDIQLYNTNAIPLSTAQLAVAGYNSFVAPVVGVPPNPITYWAQNGSNILMSTRPRFSTGAPADILNIGTTGNAVSFNNQSRAAIYTNPLNPFNANGQNITIVAFRDTVISGPSVVNPLPAISTIPIYAPSGNILY
ncbi:MAG: filamentous hemagglutinin N-terminal domain-containing protein [Chlamydiia bacterium]|nr:filamentous hemagglutinin N-terminal domain-containing protein [Chlamydiia bacterium]